jgi:uncharacterized membrane protein YeaQ/YmgE (transglycosylase-associated protein family)
MNKWTKFAGTVGALFGFMLFQRHTDWQTTAGLLLAIGGSLVLFEFIKKPS